MSSSISVSISITAAYTDLPSGAHDICRPIMLRPTIRVRSPHGAHSAGADPALHSIGADLRGWKVDCSWGQHGFSILPLPLHAANNLFHFAGKAAVGVDEIGESQQHA